MSSKSRYLKTSKPGVYGYKGNKGICYYINYRIDGKQKQEKVGWDYDKVTVTKAHDLRMKRVSDAKFGKKPPVVSKDFTLNDVWKLYLHYLKVNDMGSGPTESTYKNHIQPYLGHLKLTKITLENTKIHWIDLSDGYQCQILATVNAMINMAISYGKYYGPNPVKEVTGTNNRKSRLRYLTKDEARCLLERLKERSYETWFQALIGLLTGLRQGNVINLHKRDLDFDSNIIIARDAKGGVDYTVAMPKVIREILENGYEYQPGGRLFRRYSEWHFNHAVDECNLNDDLPETKKNGKWIPDKRYKVVWHTLRHTFGTWLAQKGETLLSIQNKMGHKNAQTTLRYTKYMPGNEHEVVDELADDLLD